MMRAKAVNSGLMLKDSQQMKPSFFLNEGKYRIEQAILNGASHKRLADVVKGVYSCPIFKRMYVDNAAKGHQYITASDMMKTNPIESCKLISKSLTKNPESMMLTANQMLVSCAGTVGNVRLITKDLEGIVGSQDIIRVDADEDHLPYGFIYAYLSSDVVFQYVQSMIYGSVVPRLEPATLGTLPVLIPSVRDVQDIHLAIEKAAKLRVEANALLSEAVQSLQKRLPTLSFPKSYVAKSDSFWCERLRLDATAHLTLIDQFLDKAGQNASLVTIESVSERVFTPGIFKRMRVSDPNKGIPFLSGINLLEIAPKFDSFLSRKMPSIDDYILREGWLALQDSGSLSSMGYVSIVPKFLDGASATNNLIRVMPGEVNHNPYFYAFLKTAQGQHILKSFAYGTGQLHIDNGQIARLRVPVYQDLFDTITANVQAYSVKFNEAYQLETGAIARVEELVGSW